MKQTANIFGRLLDRWKSQGLSPRPPCTFEEVRAFEQRERVVLPADLRAYWFSVDGMPDKMGQSQDSEGFSFWPLSRVIRADRELQRKSSQTTPPVDCSDYYVFADYLDWSWAYAVKLRSTEAGKVIIVGAQTVSLVAGSFSDFIEVYLADGRNLYPAT
jgi:hypothetical protein